MAYDIGNAEFGITMDEITQKSAERQQYLAQVLKRREEYEASQSAVAQDAILGNATTPSATTSSANLGDLGFLFADEA